MFWGKELGCNHAGWLWVDIIELAHANLIKVNVLSIDAKFGKCLLWGLNVQNLAIAELE